MHLVELCSIRPIFPPGRAGGRERKMGNYWHGGPRGLKGWILPSTETGAPTTADYGADKVCRRDCVYVTNNRLAAEMFGSMAPASKVSVYLVQPYGILEPDPDCTEKGLSFQCEKALIVKEFPIRPAHRKEMMRCLLISS